MSMLPESREKKADKQCWDCLKRRLVCDRTIPRCRKCQNGGKQCLGYGEEKPLQWVPVGKITARRSKNSSTLPSTALLPPSKGSTLGRVAHVPPNQPIDGGSVNLNGPSSPTPPCEDENEDLAFWQSAFGVVLPTQDDDSQHLTKEQHDTVICSLAPIHARILKDIDRMFRAGSRARIEDIVARGLHDKAAKLLHTQRQPVKILEHLLIFMRSEKLPYYDFLSDETTQVVQAVHYYNSRIHPDVLASGELAPNPAMTMFPLQALHVLPPTVHHTFVCMSVNHFIHSLPVGADKQIAVANRLKLYHHRGAAIRSLNYYISQDRTRCSDVTIASILMFMSVDLQSPLHTDWRSHALAMQYVVNLRGGFKNLLKQAPFLAPTLVTHILIITMANTCSPASDQVQPGIASDDMTIAEYTDLYNHIFPYTLCPPELFTAVLQINDLRAKTSISITSLDARDFSLALEAHNLLNSITSFVPEAWAQPGTYYDEFLTIGTIYQAATVIYCIMALQSLTLLSPSPSLNSTRSSHGERLLANLQRGLQSPRLAKFLAWPLVVAGVEAGYRGAGARNWIDVLLGDLSRSLGTNSPLKARTILRRYWRKDVPGWEACFDCRDATVLACGIC